MTSTSLQTIDLLSPGGNLDAYIQAVHSVPVLSAEREAMLARDLQIDGDLDSARQLVLAHLRFVVYVARSYSGYGLSEADLIQEGNVGLMKAVRRFDPDYKVRLVSFAVHWIKAEIHEFILKNWRIVKIATTKAQRKLFFNLRSKHRRLGWMNEKEIHHIAAELNVDPAAVRLMEGRLASRDEAFDSPVDDDEDVTAPVLYLEDVEADPGQLVELAEQEQHDHGRLMQAFRTLDARSREIVSSRWLTDRKSTLHELADRFGISAERVRQLERNALSKLRTTLS